MSKARPSTRKQNYLPFYKSIQKMIAMLLFVFLGTTISYAQPINDYPSDAIEIPVSNNNQYHEYSNTLATNSMVQPTPSCGQYQGADVWFKMLVPASGFMQIKTKTNVNPKVVAAVYTGELNNFEEYTCSDESAQGNVSSLVTIQDPALGGTIIYLRVFRYGATSGGELRVAAYEIEGGSVSNDNLSTAIQIADRNCTFEFTTYSTEDATSSGVEAPPCGKLKGGDIWFKAEVPMSGKLVVETNPGSITPVVSVYTGTQDNNLALYDCSLSGAIDNGGEILIDDPDLAGEEINIRIFAHNDKWGGTFDLVVMEPRLDVCSDAIELRDISAIEKYVPYTNQYANENGTEPTCGPFTGKDIWFIVKVPENGELEINTKVDEAYDVKPVLTVYTGTCGNLTQYACNYFGSENPFGAKIDINDPGLSNEYIYVRMYAFNDAVGGAFQMSTRQPNPSSLPVELVSFRSQVVDNEAVVLTWETATELNNDYFIVEHSVDGRDYIPVGHVTGNGTTNDIQYYTFEHDRPYFGENYYRLKQVDFDGQFEYSNIVTAIIKMEEAKINVFPNPVVASRGINIRWIGDFGKENIQLIISNTVGKQVFLTEIDVTHQRESFIDLSTLGLSAGIYYLTVNDENALIANQKINLVRD